MTLGFPYVFTAKGSVLLWTGQPDTTTLFIGAQVSVRPALAGVDGAVDPGPYPPFVPPDGVTEPDPVPLFDAPPNLLAVLGAGGAAMRTVTTGQDGTFAVTLPTPDALAYAAGARTDADLDPTRGGAYSVQYVAVMPDGRLVLFLPDMALLGEDGSLDVTSLLSAPSL